MKIVAFKKLFSRMRVDVWWKWNQVEWNQLINILLSMVEKTKKDFKMQRWIHTPCDSEEYLYYRAVCGNYDTRVWG